MSVTMMFAKRILIGAGLLALTVLVGMAQAQRTITLEAWTIGPDEPAIHRAENLEAAVDLLNEELEAEGADFRVAINTDFETVSWDDFRRRLLLAFDAGTPPDIIVSSHLDIATWSDAGYLLPLDDYLPEHDAFDAVVAGLWDFVTYRGSVYGVPINPEARPFYYNTSLLRELGWSDEEVEALPQRIEQGEFTWNDVVAVGREAVEAGVVEAGHGYWHRPANGPDFYHTYFAFGGRLQDPETGNLVFTQEAALGLFGLYAQMVEEGVMLREIIGMPWTEWHRTWADGNVLFTSAGTWSWAQWAVEFGMGYEHMNENYHFALQPAAEPGGRPVTLSHPLAYMVAAQSEHDELSVRLLSHVATPELDLRALESGHLPALESTRALPEFQEDPFLSQVVYMLDYTTAQPVHEGFGRYADIFFRSISAVEGGQLSPEDAVAITVEELERALGDQVVIE
jgi:inositol-phosphate transport system substrate-binding protein